MSDSNTTAAQPARPESDSQELDRSFVRGIAWTGAIKWGTQVFTWASTLIVARLLTPADYGIVSLATVYLSILTLLSEFGVGAGVVALRELTETQVAQLNSLAVLIGFGGFALSCVVAIPAGRFFHSPQVPAVLVLMSTTLIINSLQSVPSALLRKELRFKLLSSIEGIKAIALAAVPVLLALWGFGYWTLVFSVIASSLLGTTMILWVRRHPFAWPRKTDLAPQLRFSRNVVVTGVAFAIYIDSDFVVAGRVLGQAALGAYNIAWTFANAPLEKVTSLIGYVTPSYFSAVQNDNAALRRYLLKPTEAIAFIVFPVMAGIALVARDAISLFLGPKWEAAIVPLQLLAVYAIFRCLMTLLPQILTVKGETAYVMKTALVSLVVLPTAFFVGSHWGIKGIAAAWVAAYPINWLPFYIRTAKRIDLKISEYFHALRPALEATLVMAASVAAIKWTMPATVPVLVRLIIEITVGAAAYAVVHLLLHRRRLDTFIRAYRLMRS